MAHKKAGSSVKNGRDSAGQRLGVKAGDGQLVPAGHVAAVTDPTTVPVCPPAQTDAGHEPAFSGPFIPLHARTPR